MTTPDPTAGLTPDEKPDDHRPYLTIPYWPAGTLSSTDPGDDGQIRPVPAGIVSYLCPGIHASPYTPGKDLTVTVDVRNSGGGNITGLVTVTVWWEYPALGFGTMGPNNLIGVALVPVPPRGQQKTTTAMAKLIPASAGPHVCLLARVSHPLDPAGSVPDAVGNRHWAQRNLFALSPAPGVPLDLTIWAINPFQQEAEFVLRVRPVGREGLYQLARTVRADPIVTKARFGFRDGGEGFRRGAAGESRESFSLTLPAGGRTPVHLRMDLDTDPEDGQFAGFEILQQQGDRVVGSLGVVVLAPNRVRS